uniref:Osteoclast-stimulating factor 1 n=1 Tax=Salarias fasciatus TaxID=181472 RepID=A0A672IH43_SALFA
MEMWRQCAIWLIDCRVLPENRVTWEGAQVCDLAQVLRDGVLLCQLLNNLLPQAVNLREINLRPQMSQFLCLKNIRTFLGACHEKFHLKKNELFEAFDLFDVRDFAKVPSHHVCLCVHQKAFPLEACMPDDEIYSGDCLDLFREPVSCTALFCMCVCLQELADTHLNLLEELQNAILNHGAKNLHQVFLSYKERYRIHTPYGTRKTTNAVHLLHKNLHALYSVSLSRLLLYGRYCSQVETATKHLDYLSNEKEDIKMKLEECSKRANSGRFSLRDLLMVPMQRVLKYPLLLQELMKHTTDPTDKENLRTALDAMRDLAQCVNEVKRDNEIIRQITTFQLSIENMNQSLALYGRPKIDGELKICSSEKKSKQDRYAFLFDKAVFICKKKSGETFELKDIIELQHYQIRDETTGGKDNKKWSYLFLLLDCYGKNGYDLFFKTRELKKKWLTSQLVFAACRSNMCPENATANNHDFQMHCFEETTSCKACSMLLRGIFFQGYRCSRCKIAAHKECLGRVATCGRNSGLKKTNKNNESGFPKMEVCQDYFGLPPPPVGFGQPLQLSKGDVVELTRAGVDLAWWEGKNLTIGQMGWFPSNKVQPYVSVSQFAGNMDRTAAKNLLMSRSDGTFLVRQKDGGDFAISLKFNMDIRHIKITSAEGLYRINDKIAFRGIVEMIQFYQKNSLKDYFKEVDTTLLTPYKQPEQSSAFNAPPNAAMRSFGVARARYDFSARDRSELSLREGDTIKILTKKGHNGWWKGEVYGRVGLFPANYVEEDYSDYC